MRYGKHLAITNQGSMLVIKEEQIVNWDSVRHMDIYTETTNVKNDKEVLAEFLKLIDDRKQGKKRCIGLQTIEDDTGNIIRVEKTWVAPELRET